MRRGRAQVAVKWFHPHSTPIEHAYFCRRIASPLTCVAERIFACTRAAVNGAHSLRLEHLPAALFGGFRDGRTWITRAGIEQSWLRWKNEQVWNAVRVKAMKKVPGKCHCPFFILLWFL